MKNKYRNTITEIDGIKFHSKKEAERYLQLKKEEEAGTISRLVLQPRFLLQEGFNWTDKSVSPNKVHRIREICYIADFMYHCKFFTEIVVEDVKGRKTDVYEIKKKMFLNLYGNQYIFREEK